jgi:hypothetical protein
MDFLWTELKIGPTLVESALLTKGEGHMDHYVRAKLNAVKAAEAKGRFSSWSP